jgi:dihydroxyacetone kinase
MMAMMRLAKCCKVSLRPIPITFGALNMHPVLIIAKNGPREGKVALLIGGGSGHEPTFWGLLAKGLLMDSVAWFGVSQPHRLKHTN